MITNEMLPIENRFDLSDREVEVLHCLSFGNTIRQIAHQLGISSNTVKFHLGRIYNKLKMSTQAGAVAKSIRNGII